MAYKSRCKFGIKIFISVILISILLFQVFSVFAYSSDDVTDNGYTYWEGNFTKFAVKNKSLYEPVMTVSGTDIAGKDFASLDYVFSYEKNHLDASCRSDGSFGFCRLR